MSKKVTSRLIYIVCVLVLLWCLVSYIDVVTHNMDISYTYSNFNIFKMLVG